MIIIKNVPQSTIYYRDYCSKIKALEGQLWLYIVCKNYRKVELKYKASLVTVTKTLALMSSGLTLKKISSYFSVLLVDLEHPVGKYLLKVDNKDNERTFMVLILVSLFLTPK